MKEMIQSMKMEACTKTGWTKIYDKQQYRIIRFGNTKTLLGLVCDFTLKETMESILKKYNIIEYEIHNIKTRFEFSYQFKLKEDEYNNLIFKIFHDNPSLVIPPKLKECSVDYVNGEVKLCL
jgi:hypothetical protein